MPLPRALTLLALLPLTACSSASEDDSPPDGVSCGSRVVVGDQAGLTGALAGAGGGSCVLLRSGSLSGAFTVPKGVTLAAAKGAVVKVASPSEEPAVTLGEGASLVGVGIGASKGVGVAVRGGRARVTDVTVTGSASAALAILCDAGCPEDADAIVLTRVVLEKSQMGLWVSGAPVRWTGGESREHATTSLTLAAGVVAQDGARVELSGVKVLRNQGVGVLLDGAATRGVLTDVTVSENRERGLWAQKLQGSAEKPALEIKGSSAFERNRIVGLGGLESRGIIFVGGRVADTAAAPLVTNLGQTEDVGDGIGLFGGTGDARFETVELASNARAAGIVDNGARGIIFVGGRIAAGVSGLKIVVQNTTVPVGTDTSSTTTASKVLGISSAALSTPVVLGKKKQ